MANVPQVELLRELVAHLKTAGLPQAPSVRAAIIAANRREDLTDCTVIAVVPGVPKSERATRGLLRVNDVFDVAIQRAVPTATESDGTVRDLDWPSVQAMLELQRAVMLALYDFPGVLTVHGINAGEQSHAVLGIWTGVFQVTVRGRDEPC